ncbi:hypothetical protein BEH94_05245 [Candidatus Altiarchaeales archaeon WOR_SM1_SCG]|nr:hypothetical protein BEH94_05245 [Candidatus Altiarchaeales archaeon WOR_SM1_SCG]
MKKLNEIIGHLTSIIRYAMVFAMLVVAILTFINILHHILESSLSQGLSQESSRALLDNIMVLFVIMTLVTAVMAFIKKGSKLGMLALLMAGITSVTRSIIVNPAEDIVSQGILLLFIAVSLILLHKYYVEEKIK